MSHHCSLCVFLPLLFLAGSAVGSKANTLTTLHSFSSVSNQSTNNDGYSPAGGLIQASDGNLYGTNSQGGANGAGTVFRITTGGTFTTLYNFSSVSNQNTNNDGYSPAGGLTQAKDGNLYGTTSYGGPKGEGTIFRLTLGGTFTTLHSFSSVSNQNTNNDGYSPVGGLLLANDGNLYGTNNQGGKGLGTIFRITTGGTFTTLHNFGLDAFSNSTLRPDTSRIHSLIQAKDGNLYGTTGRGGTNGVGTIFRLTTAGTFTILHSFASSDGVVTPGGYTPKDGLIQATDGNLYGTTSQGGSVGCGTIFRITTEGMFTTLYNFGTETGDGAQDHDGGLIQATDGNLYGTTSEGGMNNSGSIFRITTGGTFNTPYSFSLAANNGLNTDGAVPVGGLLLANDGALYGTTSRAGASGLGTVFRLTLPVAWGARILIQQKDQSQPQPDYLVAATPNGVILGSAVHIDAQNNVTTDDPIPYDNVQSITILQDEPGTPVTDNGPAGRSLNRYIQPGQRSPELRSYTTAAGWSYVYYTFSNGVYTQNIGTSPASSFTAYGIPRIQGVDTAPDVYTDLTNASLAGKSSKLGLVLPRSIPRQILYAVGWHETRWRHYGLITRWDPTRPSHVGAVTDPVGDRRTLVTVDGGIGILQTTNDTNLTTCPQPNPTFDQLLTHIYRMAADRAYQIQVGAYHLAHDKWPVENTDGEVPEFLEHWYYPLRDYNGAESYVFNTNASNPGLWQIIQSASYKSLLPAPQKNDPGVQPVPLIREEPQFADWNFDGTLDLQMTGVTMKKAVDSHNKTIAVNLAVTLTPLNGFANPTAVSITLKPPKGNAIGPIVLSGPDANHVFKAQALGTFSSSQYTLLINITANGATKRAVYVLGTSLGM